MRAASPVVPRALTGLVALSVAAAVTLTAGPGASGPSTRHLAPEVRPTSAAGVPVMGPSQLGAGQLARWYRAQNRAPRLPVTIEELAAIFVDEGRRVGVRGDLAFVQSVIETGWFEFRGSMVRPEDFNYAGLGACDSCTTGRRFPTPRLGIRAQVQHLRNYADPTSRAAQLPNPPVRHWYAWPSLDPERAAHNFDTFFAKGRAPTWNQMGGGNWATDPGYGTKVLSLYNRALVFNGLPGVCPPDRLGFGTAQAPQCPVAIRHPGRAVAARPQGGSWILNGNGAVTGVGAPTFGAPRFDHDAARDLAAMPDGNGYLVLDAYGTVHKFGSATSGPIGALGSPRFGFDIARSLAVSPDGAGYAVLDGWGGIHSYGSMPRFTGAPYWAGWDIARAIAPTPDGTGLFVLDGWGGVHALGTARTLGGPYWPGWDIARDLVATPSGNGYAVLDGWGWVHTIGDAPGATSAGWFPADRWRGLTLAGTRWLAVRNDGLTSLR